MPKDKRVDPTAQNNSAIRFASQRGHIKTVKLLLRDKRVSPSSGNNHAFYLASHRGHNKIVKFLLQDKRTDLTLHDNIAIIWESLHGLTETVKILLAFPYVDPSDQNYAALDCGITKIITRLLLDSRVSFKKFETLVVGNFKNSRSFFECEPFHPDNIMTKKAFFKL